jgi:ABC-2 type transport system permease protein
MIQILYIIKREFLDYFYNPLGYILMTCFLLLKGLMFWYIVNVLNSPDTVYGSIMQSFFNQNLELFFIPFITMKLFSEEIKSGNIENLITSPVTETQIVIGKFSSAVLLYIVLWLPTIIYPVILNNFIKIEWLTVFTGYLGVILVGIFFVSIGMFCSALTKSQVSSAILSFIIIIFVLLFPLLKELTISQNLINIIEYTNVFNIIDTFSKGVLDTRYIIFLFSITTGIVYINIKFIELRKWI